MTPDEKITIAFMRNCLIIASDLWLGSEWGEKTQKP